MLTIVPNVRNRREPAVPAVQCSWASRGVNHGTHLALVVAAGPAIAYPTLKEMIPTGRSERKHGHSFNLTPFAAFVFAANEAPIFSDQTDASHLRRNGT